MELKEKLKTQFEKERNELLQNIAEEVRRYCISFGHRCNMGVAM